MKNLFGEGCDPVTGTALGRAFRPDAVAGFDLTFSPAKSVSALWAVAPPEVAQLIRQAHNAAVLDALAFLEAHAIFTREGTDGVRQVETRGLIAAAFLHRDSRAGDPDLHTHVAVANKVQTREGKWLSIYGTVLHQYVVATSEAYNTALEAPPRRRPRRPVRRRTAGAAASVRSGRSTASMPALCAAVVAPTPRHRGPHRASSPPTSPSGTAAPPTAKESIALAQRANLETRAAKHEPRSEAEQRATWRGRGGPGAGQRGLRAHDR